MASYEVVNLTGHEIRVVDDEGCTKAVYPADRNPARIRRARVPVGDVNGAPVYQQLSDLVVAGLPDMRLDQVFVVSRESREQLSGRPDVVAPDARQNEDGSWPDVKAFIR